MQTNFLIPLKKVEIEKLFDPEAINILKYYLKISLFSQPNSITDNIVLPIQIPKEHLEQFIVQSLGCIPMGAGSYPVDLIDKVRGFGADIKMLSCLLDRDGHLSNTTSGETSLAQKFSDNDLDGKFFRQEHSEIINDWKDILSKKYQKVVTENNIENIYYFFILRADDCFYLTGTKLELKNINNLTLQRRVYNSKSNSIFLDNVIDSKFGQAKIYKAKKRLELRLYAGAWEKDHAIKLKQDRVSETIKLRGLGDKNFKAFKEEGLKRLKNMLEL